MPKICSFVLFVFAAEGLVLADGFTSDLKWLADAELPIEGRAFALTRTPFERLPAEAVGRVTPAVAHLMTHTSGLTLHFRTDSARLALMWDLSGRELDAGNLSRIGKSGFDLYQRGADGRWRFRRSFAPSAQKGNRGEYVWSGGTNAEFLVNFPLYNGVTCCRLGLAVNATYASAVRADKPIVFYGVSTTQGASASRPGMSFPAIIGRRLDMPVINLGFSGAGCMEMEMCDYVARIDARLYVIDTPGNMSLEMMKERYEKFLRELRRRRPDVPIVLAGQRVYRSDAPAQNDKTAFLAALMARLLAEKDGCWSLALVRTEDMFPRDVDETTVDSPDGHPSDFGMIQLADAYGSAIEGLLRAGQKKSACWARPVSH